MARRGRGLALARCVAVVASCLCLGAELALAAETRGRSARASDADDVLPEGASAALVAAMRAELERSRGLRMQGAPDAYFTAYRVIEVDEIELIAELGSLVMEEVAPHRYVRVDVRVGDPAAGGDGEALGDSGAAVLTVDDDVDVLRRQLWLATDESYKTAIEALESQRAERTARGGSVALPAFADQPATSTVVDTTSRTVDRATLVGLVERLSSLMRDAPHVFEGGVVARAIVVRRYFMSSEGTFGYEPSMLLRVAAVARAQADDGMNLIDYDEVLVATPQALPPEAEMVRRVRAMLSGLATLRAAAPASAYVGPVIFEGQAAGALLARLLASQLAGVPIEDASTNAALAAGTEVGFESVLSRRVGKRVAPEWLDVYDDPGLRGPAGAPFVGSYAFDDEGVPGRRVNLISGGKLSGFVTSRAPASIEHRSTGHGRGGLTAVAAVTSNLVITSGRQRPPTQLAKLALREAAEVGERGVIVVRRLDDEGVTQLYRGADTGGRSFRNAPLVLSAVRLLPDGTEEPVRGLSLVSLDVRALRDLMATGESSARYAYTTSSGGSGSPGFWRSYPLFDVGCTVTSPSLLFSEMELAPEPSLRSSAPLLPPPSVTDGE